MTIQPQATLAREVDPRRDHIRGPVDAPITLVEYGDYECPYCGRSYPVVNAVQRALREYMRFVYRHFPLTTVHPHAQNAAEAAEAAGSQGKFWQMHDMLFTHQHALTDHHLLEYAAQIGLDVVQFRIEMAEHGFAERVRIDFISGVRSGVGGTPTFFINGMQYVGSHDPESMLEAIRLVAGAPAL